MEHEQGTTPKPTIEERIAQIRAGTVGANKNFRRITVTWNGIELDIQQPSVTQRNDILNAGKAGKSGVKDTASLMATALVLCSYVPGTAVQPFGPADLDSIRKMPAGGDADEIFQRIMQLMNAEDDHRKLDLGEIEKVTEHVFRGGPVLNAAAFMEHFRATLMAESKSGNG